MPLPHAIIITDQDEVWQFYIDPKNNAYGKLLFQLPKNKLKYFVFSDTERSLYFLRQNLQGKIIQYDKNINNQVTSNRFQILNITSQYCEHLHYTGLHSKLEKLLVNCGVRFTS